MGAAHGHLAAEGPLVSQPFGFQCCVQAPEEQTTTIEIGSVNLARHYASAPMMQDRHRRPTFAPPVCCKVDARGPRPEIEDISPTSRCSDSVETDSQHSGDEPSEQPRAVAAPMGIGGMLRRPVGLASVPSLWATPPAVGSAFGRAAPACSPAWAAPLGVQRQEWLQAPVAPAAQPLVLPVRLFTTTPQSVPATVAKQPSRTLLAGRWPATCQPMLASPAKARQREEEGVPYVMPQAVQREAVERGPAARQQSTPLPEQKVEGTDEHGLRYITLPLVMWEDD